MDADVARLELGEEEPAVGRERDLVGDREPREHVLGLEAGRQRENVGGSGGVTWIETTVMALPSALLAVTV